MRKPHRLPLALGLALAATTLAPPTPAQDPPPAPEPEPEAEPDPEPESDPDPDPEPDSGPDPEAEPAPDPTLTRAKDLHRKGLALLSTGDVERALDYFQRSRDLYPSTPNVTNVAICLERLGRYDEALEAYEVLLTEFADGLSAEDRAAVAPAMARLRNHVGSLWISANETGTVIVDGRERGKLPLRSPIRVLAGEHVVRIQKPGFEPWKQRVTAEVKQTKNLETRLMPLANVGVLRVESEAPAVLVIDGAEVGPTPWEGPLSPGEHLVWLRAGELGSAAQRMVIVEGQIALVRPRLVPLSPEVRVRVVPATASIVVDGLVRGVGSWADRLPAGDHAVVLTERGYLERRLPIRALPGEAPVTIDLRLEVDRDHPRWPKPTEPGHLWVDGFVGYTGGPTMGTTAEADCGDGCRGLVVRGGMGMARVGYRFPMQLSLEMGLGYTVFGGVGGQRIHDETFDQGTADISYRVNHRPLVRGPFVAPGLGYRLPVVEWLAFEARTALGILFAAASDDVEGDAGLRGVGEAHLETAKRDLQRAVTIFVMPSLGANLSFGAFDVGAGLAVALFPLEGPTLDNGPLRPSQPRDEGDRAAIGNAPATDFIAGERAWGPMALWVPHLRAGCTF